MGQPLRFPLLSYVSLKTIWEKWRALLLFGIIFSSLYYEKLNLEHINKNFLVFVLCVGGALFYSHRSSIDFNKRFVKLTGYIPFIFIVYWVMQWLGIDLFGEYFKTSDQFEFPRFAGFSGEPSFFAYMIFYFSIVYMMCSRRINYAVVLAYLVLGALSMSFTYLGLCLIGAIIYYLCKYIHSIWCVIFFPLVYVLLDIFTRIIVGTTASNLFLDYTGSWREPSIYCAIYGSELLGPLSGGELWAETMRNGQIAALGSGNELVWLIWPFSFFSMLLTELGWVLTFGIIYYLLKTVDMHLKNKEIKKNKIPGVILLLTIGMFIAPKWCVYYFFIPLRSGYIKNDK